MELLGAKIEKAHTSVDFGSFYVAGYQARTHPSEIYDLEQQQHLQHTLTSSGGGSMAFYHPSYQTLLFIPFSFLSYRSAYLSFIALNLVLLLAAFFAARPAFSSVIPMLQPRPGLVFFAFEPLLGAILVGQDSLLSLLLCCLAWTQLQSGNEARAGFLMALALFKFQLALPIAALLVIRFGWRFLTGFLLTFSAVVLACIGIGGTVGAQSYLKILLGAGSAVGTKLAEQKLTISPLSMPNLAGLIYATGSRFLYSPIAFDLVVGCLTILLFSACALAIRRLDLNAAFSVAILCGLLVSYHLYEYDLTLALLPVTLMAGRIHRYILAALFLLPIGFLALGADWIFLLALVLLAMLVNVTIFARNDAKSTPELPDIALA